MAAPSLALAHSARQRAAWERRRIWESSEGSLSALRTECVSARALRKMREQRGRGIRTVDLAELDGLRFGGEKAARPFVRVLAGVLLHSSARGIADSHAQIALMLGAFGHPVGETCLRRALGSLEAAGVIEIRHDFQRHPKERPFVSKRDKQRPVRLLTERGRIIVAGPRLLEVLESLRKGNVRRNKQGCPKKTTHSDPLPEGEVKNTDRAHVKAPSEIKPETRQPAAAAAVIAPRPLAAEDQVARKVDGLFPPRAVRPDRTAGAARPLTALAKGHPTGPRRVVEEPGAARAPRSPVHPWRRLWVASSVEDQLAEHCRTHRRKRAEVVAEALRAYTHGQVGAGEPQGAPLCRSAPPPVAPRERASHALAQVSLALLRARLAGQISAQEFAGWTARLDAQEISQVADELAACLAKEPGAR